MTSVPLRTRTLRLPSIKRPLLTIEWIERSFWLSLAIGALGVALGLVLL